MPSFAGGYKFVSIPLIPSVLSNLLYMYKTFAQVRRSRKIRDPHAQIPLQNSVQEPRGPYGLFPEYLQDRSPTVPVANGIPGTDD